MENYFDSEIKYLEKELIALKTSMQRSAGVVPIVRKTLALSIPLELNSAQTLSNGEVAVKVTTGGDSALIIPTLDKYENNIYYDPTFAIQDGWANVELGVTPSGGQLVNVFVRGSDSDTQALISGGTVVKSVKLTVQCSEEFEMGVV